MMIVDTVQDLAIYICLRSTIGFKPGKRTVVRIAMHSVDKSPGTARETRSVIMGLSLVTCPIPEKGKRKGQISVGGYPISICSRYCKHQPHSSFWCCG